MISTLKDNYYTLLANNGVLPYDEYSLKVPISTGSPLLDSFLVEPIKSTTKLMDHEHLLRLWRLLKNISDREEEVLIKNLNVLLNDHKIMLALQFWLNGDEEETLSILKSLPWSWRLQFPILLIKPSYVFFTGWKKDLEFRLTNNINFEKLRNLFGILLEESSEQSILKYKRKIKVSWALLKYKPQTMKEKAIEDWCFKNGRNAGNIKLLKIYTHARDLLKQNKSKFIKYLNSEDETIPLTSYMGLLGNRKIDLKREEDNSFRDYALRSATLVETVLRLNEWSKWPKKRPRLFRFLYFVGPHWLDSDKAKEISTKIREGVTSDIPFDKIANAYLNCDSRTKALLTKNLFLPLLKEFGAAFGKVLPQKFNFVQPANIIHIDNFLTYNVLNVSSKGKMILLGEKEDFEFTFSIDELAPIIHQPVPEVERYLLNKFGELTDKYRYTYNGSKIAKKLGKLDNKSLLILDLPFLQSLDVMNSIKSFDYVLNMNCYYGVPNEISLVPNYSPVLSIWTPSFSLGYYRRYSSAYGLIKYIRLLNIFQKIGKEYGNHS